MRNGYLKPHQKVEVHARYLHSKYESDWLSIEGAMRNGSKSVTEGSLLLASVTLTLTPVTSNLIQR
ncbi:hypothetical protein DPMN_078857 [Dreissena polymorpha]|uniref:Uncharacterized protein n=1 Tax=Dreissena polymorpha TaxID=45954 RepID=A0A9D3YRD5_DREPO|nr:hypothetical protein DPMN_078857 [Dreissena polymorpha]